LQKAREKDAANFKALYEDLAGHYQRRLTVLSGEENPAGAMVYEHHQRYNRLMRELLRVERHTAVRLRNEGHINDETLRELEHELDLQEAGLDQAAR
jgi:hypothetical protein